VTPLAVVLWLLNVTLDTVGQLAFKAAASDPEAGDGVARWRYMASRPWLWVGILSYVAEFLVWIAFLSLVDLSEGVLLGSINIVVIMIAGRILFREKLTPLRVTGILLVTAGVCIVGVAGGG
jgi:drug/metabolite transporter (DMT)-like permease